MKTLYSTLILFTALYGCSGSNVDRAVIASGHLAESKDCQLALYSNHDIAKFTACQDAVDTRFGILPRDGGAK